MKKTLALLLVLCMVFGLMPTALADGASSETGDDYTQIPAEEINPPETVPSTGETRGTARHDENEDILAVVTLTAPSLIDLFVEAQGSGDGASRAKFFQDAFAAGKDAELMVAQEPVLEAIRDITGDAGLTPVARMVTLFNGFFVKVRYGDLDDIRMLEGVDQAYESHVFAAPDPVAVGTDLGSGNYESHSYDMVGLGKAWEEGWTGQGMVVAVLDTGLDLQYSTYWDPTAEDPNPDSPFEHGANVTQIRHTHEAFRGTSFMSESPSDFVALDEDQVMIPVNSRALHATKELIRGELPATGFYKNLKVPYAFDYAGTIDPETYEVAYGDLNVYPGNNGSDHGTHVSGTILGYVATEDGEIKFSGIAPDAQLLAMKVFDDNGAGSSELSFAYALEDALILGADVINMSYGSDNGFEEDESGTMEYYHKLEKAGVILMTSAGNSGNSTAYTNYDSHNLTTDPETSMMSSPAIYSSNMAVASINNHVTALSYLDWKDSKGNQFGASFSDPFYESVRYLFRDDMISHFEGGIPIIPAGVGNPSDFADAGFLTQGSHDNEGKTGIALVKRGGENEDGEVLSFVDKINNAMQYAWTYTDTDGTQHAGGVLAVFIYDSDPNSETLIAMSVEGTALTSAFVSGKTGEAMLAAAKDGGAFLTKVEQEDRITEDHAEGGQMSSFSSWGAGPGLELKPDITAPGGNIWSSVFDYTYPYDSKVGTYTDYVGGYSMMSGTSMAAPHMTGMAALVRQYVRDKIVKGDIEENYNLEDEITNALLVSTAVPQMEGDAYYSPRYQGAGLANVGYAVTTPAYITVDDQLVGKLEFSDDYEWTGKFNGTFAIHNITDNAVTYSGKIYIMVPDTGKAANSAVEGSAQRDVMLDSDRILRAIDLADVTVAGNDTENVTVNIELTTEEIAELKELFPNGIYVEGYIVLESEGHPNIGLPYLGYLGDWTAPAIFDAHTWLESSNGSIWNNENTWANSVVGFYNGYGFINLGQNPLDESSETYQEVYHEENIAISPNGLVSGINDFLLYQLRDTRVIVLEARNAVTDELYYRDVEPFLPKTLYSGDYGTPVPMSAMYMTETWDGTNMGAARPNGTFTGNGDPIPSGTRVTFTIAGFGEGDYSALGTTTFSGRTVTNYWNIDLSNPSTWPTFNNHEMDMRGDTIEFEILIDKERPKLKDGVITSFTDNGRRYITGTVTDNASLAGVEVIPQVTRRDAGDGDEVVRFDYNSPIYTKMIYDAALQELTFVADVTDVKINNPYEDTDWDFEFEWTGGILISGMDYAGNEGDFVTRVSTDGTEPESGLTVTPNSGLMYVGDTFDFSVIDSSAAGGIEFESADSNVATVNAAGHVEAVAPGQTVITVKNGNGALEKVVVAVRERPTEVKDFKLTLESFNGLSPDGAIIVKIQDVTPADVLLGGTDGLMVSWSVREDEETAEKYGETALIDVTQYTVDAMTGMIYLYASTKVDSLGNPILGTGDLSGGGILTVTLGGEKNPVDGSISGGLSKEMEFKWKDLYDAGENDGLISNTSLDGEQTIYVKEGETATLSARYRDSNTHNTVPVRLYTAVGASSPSTKNSTEKATGLILDGPDFVGVDSRWEGWIVNEEGYALPESIRLFTRYTSDGNEIEKTNTWTQAFEYDPQTGHIVVPYGPAGSASEMVIRADGVEKTDNKAGTTHDGEYTKIKPDGLYGPFNWTVDVSGVQGEYEYTDTGITFKANGPGVSYITATSNAMQGSDYGTLNFAVITLPTTANSIDVGTSTGGRVGHMIKMNKDDTDKFNVILDPMPSQEKDKELVWTSYNESVATVDEEGNVTALASGYAYIGVMLNNRDADSGNPLETYFVVHVKDPNEPEPEPQVSYTVTFRDGNDTSTVIERRTVDKGASIGTMPTPPEHPGYRFTRWEDGDGNTVNANTIVNASMNVFARYSVISSGGGAGSAQPSTPTDPVVITNDVEHDGSVSTETRAKPEATVQGGIATAEITEAMGDEMIKQALANGSESVGVVMESSAGVTSFKATFPGSVVSDIAEKTDAALCMEAPIIDFDIPNAALAELGGCDTLTVTASKENGAVTFDILADGKSVGDTVGTIKAKLDLKYGEVAVMVHPDGTETIIPKSTIENGKTYVVLEGCTTVKVVNNSKNFEDVHGEWFSSAVSFVSSHELFVGTSATEFSPNANMTRADLATVLWRLESSVEADGGIDFTDVPNNVYYTNAVEWASVNHVIEGTAPGIFAPVNNVTRQEMVTMIYRYVQALGMDTGDTVNLTGFKDSGKVASWAEDAMEWSVANGIIQGKGDNVLAPEATATRAEVATIMERLVEYIVK